MVSLAFKCILRFLSIQLRKGGSSGSFQAGSVPGFGCMERSGDALAYDCCSRVVLAWQGLWLGLQRYSSVLTLAKCETERAMEIVVTKDTVDTKGVGSCRVLLWTIAQFVRSWGPLAMTVFRSNESQCVWTKAAGRREKIKVGGK